MIAITDISFLRLFWEVDTRPDTLPGKKIEGYPLHIYMKSNMRLKLFITGGI
jgi:hypothetical protein